MWIFHGSSKNGVHSSAKMLPNCPKREQANNQGREIKTKKPNNFAPSQKDTHKNLELSETPKGAYLLKIRFGFKIKVLPIHVIFSNFTNVGVCLIIKLMIDY